eukprot:4826333-Prorocentrum_lima.AAC.1
MRSHKLTEKNRTLRTTTSMVIPIGLANKVSRVTSQKGKANGRSSKRSGQSKGKTPNTGRT